MSVSPREEFDRRGYVILRSVLPAVAVKMVHRYAMGYAGSAGAGSDRMVPGAPAGYAHPCMERVLLQLLPTIEGATGRALFPTYSYFRVYREGDTLQRHKDRPACEISVSLSLGYEGATDWPLWLEGTEGPIAASLQPGDGVLYRGIELTHWREPFRGKSAAQVFLHYVDQAGPHAEWRFDKRKALRLQA